MWIWIPSPFLLVLLPSTSNNSICFLCYSAFRIEFERIVCSKIDSEFWKWWICGYVHVRCRKVLSGEEHFRPFRNCTISMKRIVKVCMRPQWFFFLFHFSFGWHKSDSKKWDHGQQNEHCVLYFHYNDYEYSVGTLAVIGPMKHSSNVAFDLRSDGQPISHQIPYVHVQKLMARSNKTVHELRPHYNTIYS